MPDLHDLVAALPERADVAALVRGFVPPERFADKRFDNYHPRHPSQSRASERLARLAAEMREAARGGLLARLATRLSPGSTSSDSVYLDGGFGVGKTHLLAAFWHAAPAPKAYLAFDELVHFIGLVGVGAARDAFSGLRVATIDEWELDDPGNLKLAVAFLRGALQEGVRVVVTSNTLPLELGQGRFSQKDFRAEIEELAGAFEVVRIEGTDYRHRHFEAHPGKEYFLDDRALTDAAAAAGDGALTVGFDALIAALAGLHPIRYGALVRSVDALFITGMRRVDSLLDALRWVHFVDTLYGSGVPLRATSSVPLGDVFPADFVVGPYGKKVSRCLSRLEELLGEEREETGASPA